MEYRMARIDRTRNTPARTVGLLGSVLVFLLAHFNGCVHSSYDLPRPEVRKVRIEYSPLGRVSSFWSESQAGASSDTPARWIPSAGIEDRDRWHGIIVHHSATHTGNAPELHFLHQKRKDRNGDPWLGMGYHFVINNGHGGADGQVEVGFRWQKQMTGAHCRPRSCSHNYWNEHTIGICLVGNFERERPTQAQYNSLTGLIRFLQQRYHIPANMIQGHRDIAGAVTACPGRYFSWEILRQKLGSTMVAAQ